MKGWTLSTVVFLALGLAAAMTCCARPITLNDLLSVENVAEAATDPTGAHLAIEFVRRYSDLPDYGVGLFGSNDGSYPILRVYDVLNGQPRAVPFDTDASAYYRIGSFSPDGRYLAFYRIRSGEVRLGIYSFLTRSSQILKYAPASPGIPHGIVIAWAEGRLIYAALPSGDEPFDVVGRRYSGSRMYSEWKKAWAGKYPSVSEVTSTSSNSPAKGDGMLVAVSLADGSSTIIAHGEFEDLVVSPGSGYLAAVEKYNNPADEKEGANSAIFFGHDRLILLNLRTLAVTLTAADEYVTPYSLVWRRDGDQLSFFGWNVKQKPEEGGFQAVDAKTKTVRSFTSHGLQIASAAERRMLDRPDHAVWIGDGLAVYARKAPRDGGSAKFSSYYARDPNVPLERADWYLLRNGVEPANLTRDFMAVSPIPPPTNADTLTVLADGNAWQIDSDGRARRLTNAGSNPLSYSALDSLWWLDPYPTMMTESAKLVSLSASKTNLTIVSSDGCARKPYVEIAVPYANAKPIAASCRGKFGVFRIDGNSGSKITFADSRGRTITLKTFNTFMRKVDWPTWRVLKYKSTNGRELSGCVLLPPNYLPGKRYSTVVAVYPGYSPRCKDGEANIDLFPNGYSQDLLASAGYIIFHPDLPISVIRTPAGPLVGLNEAVVSGLDAVVAAGYADGDDCQLIGESQGGFTALWLATQTTRFRSVVAINSWADLWSFYFDNGYWLNFYAREFQFARNASRFEAGPNTAFGLGVTPWQDQAIYLRNNPIALAPNIAEPILLVQGDLDSLASVNQFGEMFSALYRLHKQATFLRYWGEGHGMSSPANIRDLSERLQAWFESHRKHGSSNR